MPVPTLMQLDSTRSSLHRASQVISAVRAAVTPPLPNALRLSLYPVPPGLSTGPLALGGDLLLDYTRQAVVYRQPGEPDAAIDLDGHSQASLTGELLALLAEEGHDIPLTGDHLRDDTPLVIDPVTASEYAAALDTIFTAVARFRARLAGPQTPVVVWPHGFDLSTVWFAGAGADEHQDPHMNFGFSPASPGFDRPYFYSYAYPLPEGFYDVALPPLVRALESPFKGMVFDYDALVPLGHPGAEIEALFSAIYHGVADAMEVQS